MTRYQQNFHHLKTLLGGRRYRSLDNAPFLPLTLEKLEGQPLVSLAHYGEQNGDLMRDPEIVFLLDKGQAKPIYYRNDYLGLEYATVAKYFGVVAERPQLQKDLDAYVTQWWENLKEQEFFRVAQQKKAEAKSLAEAKGQEGSKGQENPGFGPQQAESTVSPKTTEVAKNGQPGGKGPKDARDVYQTVTDHIVAELEKGPQGEFVVPWRGGGEIPVNAQSGKMYRGVNVLSLWVTAQVRGYESGEWATYKQWQEMGAQVRPGEKATPVVFWKKFGGEADGQAEGEEQATQEEQGRKAGMMAKRYWVFNAAQVEGHESSRVVAKLSEGEQIREADAFFFGVGADIRHGGPSAFYDKSNDTIVLPRYETFRSAIGYYNVLAHELVHWSGAEHRVNRDLSGRFGSHRYAAEELVAELGAAFQLARLGVSQEPRPEHAQYLASWVTLLKDDKKAIFTAAAKAQQATDYLVQEHERIVGVPLEKVVNQEVERPQERVVERGKSR